ncbi:MAG: polysaccharide deacetylase family protein [Clostridia bacterium]|nr:polysaccharide deacetylase family protein [Clostridia bacterium]
MKTIVSRIVFAVISLFVCIVLVVTVSEDNKQVMSKAREVKLPVIMYHHMVKNEKMTGDYSISPDQFEKDLLYIKEKGYTTVSSDNILEFYYNNVPLPEKPIMITFDDGYESFYSYAFPLLKKYDMKAVVSLIGNYSDLYSNIPSSEKHINYSHITWDEAKIMQSSGLIEFGNHTYNLHSIINGRKGVIKYGDENFYNVGMKEDILKMQKKIEDKLGVTPYIFTYPFGARNEKSDEVIKDMGFKIILCCEEKVNILAGKDKGELYKINRFNRPGRISTQNFFKKIEKQ